MRGRLRGLCGLALLLASSTAEAQTGRCGPDCSAETITLCNDQLPLGMSTTADCSASLGSCTGEAFCASFDAGSS